MTAELYKVLALLVGGFCFIFPHLDFSFRKSDKCKPDLFHMEVLSAMVAGNNSTLFVQGWPLMNSGFGLNSLVKPSCGQLNWTLCVICRMVYLTL